MGGKKYSAGLLRVLILSELAAGESYGYELAQRLRTRSNGSLSVKATNLYPILHRLETDALIESRWVAGDIVHPQKRYRLTQDGQRAAHASVAEFAKLTSAMLLYLDRP